MLAIDEVVDHATLDWAGPIERVQCGEIFDGIRLVPPQHVAHAVRFKLEHARGQSLMKDFFVGLFILERNTLKLDFLAASLCDQFERVIQNREGCEPKEIHLQQAQLFNREHVESGNNFVVLGLM